jgi:hypothetical protein
LNKQRRLSSALLASVFISTNGSYPRKKRTSDTSAVPNWNVGEGMEEEHAEMLSIKVVLDFDGNLRRDLSRRQLVHIAPDPRFSRLDRADERVLAAMKMLGRVLVLG